MRRVTTRGLVLAVAMTAAGAPGAAAQARTVGRALERAGEAVERALEGLGRTMERAFDRSLGAPGVQAAARDFSWSGRMEEGALLEIKGVNGPIHVVAADGSEVEVRAVARGRRSDPDEVRVERVEHDGGITFCAVYPTPRGRAENRCVPGDGGKMSTRNNDVVVTFRVALPAGVRFAGRTVNGDVEAVGLGANVTAVTVNGDITISTAGWAEATTVNGSIEAALGRLDPGETLSFNTVNGRIDLDLPDDAGTRVDARWVNGRMVTDGALRLEGRIGRHHASGRVGEGDVDGRVKIMTVNGRIRLH